MLKTIDSPARAHDAGGRVRPLPAIPKAGLLTNGSFSVVITASGTGYAALNGTALTRWSGDRIEDRDGSFLYLRDLSSRTTWSLGLAPTNRAPGPYAATSLPGTFEISRRDHGIDARLEVCVAPDRPLEVRRVTLRNRSRRARRIELTSYAEIVLHDRAADAGHPAFSKLFLQTEFVPAHRALLVRRRPRSPGEQHPWLVHCVPGAGRIEHETDRERFIGRGHTTARPLALSGRARLSGTVGNVLDPIVSLRHVVRLAPGATAHAYFLLGAASERAEALALTRVTAADLDATFEHSESLARAALAREGLTEEQAAELQSRAVAKLYGDPCAAARQVTLVAPAVAPHAARSQRRASTAASRRRSGRTRKREGLRFFNGYGGFSADGTEYVIRLDPRAQGGLVRPPAPWINVLANESFGCLVSETGAGCTWSGNSREHRLTPWYNDPLLDPHGEAFYVRDEERGVFWSPLPGPAPAESGYEMRHGFGYNHCRHESHGLEQDTCVFVARHDPIKIVRVRLVNRGTARRRLSLFAYQRLVLGVDPESSAPSVVTEHGRDAGVLLARNPSAGPFASNVAFAAVVAHAGAGALHVTANRAAFLGARGTPERPAALAEHRALDGATGAGFDPCFAQQIVFDLAAGQAVEIAFLLGEEASADRATDLVRRYRAPGAVAEALDEVREFWSEFVSRVRIQTPVPAIDVMANGWLAYQTLACRLWGRSALYQSGGAFGFRDQLQDALALGMLDPDLARRQILLNAAHQFVEGDVLHWWHPPLDRGMRTRFADDLLWLPYLVATYLETTGDWAVLDEPVRFVAARALEPGEDEAYLAAADSGQTADLYDHCCRAIDRSLATGAHGLPHFGTGDWNDGMNRVGREGRGESVWMGFFLHAILRDIEPACERRSDHARIARYRAHREQLATALNDAGWDGGWYRRGYYDDGAPLGSRTSDECTIDALAQAWAVISSVAPRARARRAMDALEQRLVDEKGGLIRLLTPPFEHTAHDPGYIKGYVRGVRENGGQYTHAALWVVRALAEMGRPERAATLLEMLSPVSHARTRRATETYRVEPYVIAADVYGERPHVGRGGWTWYTGSAGWMLRVTLESVLGVRSEGGGTLVIAPRIPDDWPGFEVHWRVPGTATSYEVRVTNPKRRAKRVVAVQVDGRATLPAGGAARIPIERDGGVHRVDVVLG